ncbi:MAG: ADP-ribose pyrophosphatase [Parcubacteria group bacterium GW2011_GWD2_38_11]|nr:MAG: ADP-ribose pyrophosphatase [Parcubacteria group bacterium GW2011_GWD2_38_11]
MNKVIIASGPVIFKDGKTLLNISGKDTFWKFCGGIVEENENLIETATREAKEEMGINIKITNSEPFLLHTTKEKDGETLDIILVHFLADFTGEIIPHKEVHEHAWLDINNLPENLAPNIIPTLKHFELMK